VHFLISGDEVIKRRWKAITATWFVCLVLGSFLPLRWKTRLLLKGPLHLPVHFTVFLVSGLLLFASLRPFARQFPRFVALIGLAFAIESLQCLVFHNTFEWRDLFTDTLGVSVALLIAQVLHEIRFNSN